ncbi:MAG: NAD-binding protein, partial [Acidovorax sp.]|nr:NAD-binding protein [Acidovorax sp.]
MNWLKIGRAFSWIDSRWLRITIILLAASTMLWMYVLGEGNFASKFFRGLFFSLQFIVLNKDIDPGIDPLPFSALTFAQFALPFTASVALIGSLFQERMMPYWVRRAVAQLDGHHVIIGYGELGKRLASELIDAGSTVLAVDLSAQTARMAERFFVLQHNAMQPTLMGEANFGRAVAIYLLLPNERDNLALLDAVVADVNELQKSPKIHVRYQSRHLGQMLADLAGHKAGAARSSLDIRPFNPFDLAARGLINSFAPDHYGDIDRAGPITQTVMIVG